MKNISFVITLMLFAINVQCQKDAVFTESIRYGIYRNFAEFQHNKPSITDSFQTVYRGSYHDYPPTKLKVKSKSGDYTVSNYPFWGYFDGTNFYINRKGFNKIEKMGRYCVFEGLKKELPRVDMIDKVINVIDIKVKYLDYIFDITSGKIMKASKGTILSLLQDDRELYDDFKKNGKKGDVYIYLERYNKKHPVNYPLK